MTSGGSRRRGKPRSRILYWFRTPPGIRIGRSPLDEEAIKLIEAHNPGVEFDWARILRGEGAERQPKEREAPDEIEAAPAPPADRLPPDRLPAVAPPAVAQGKLGAEGLGRLRTRYAEMLARISEAVTDPARQDELKRQAERLNPDGWATDADVAAGLESYERVFDALRTAIGGRRKKRRRSRRRSSGQPGPESSFPSEGQQSAEDQEPAGDQDPAEDQDEEEEI